jgi:lysophospholipase L1-like esterase
MGTSDLVPPDRTLSASGAYAAAAQRVGNALGVPVLDMWTVLQQEPGWREVLLLPDGLHFSGQGQAVVGRLIREALTATHPSIR